jgi:hypothetical protein
MLDGTCEEEREQRVLSYYLLPLALSAFRFHGNRLKHVTVPVLDVAGVRRLLLQGPFHACHVTSRFALHRIACSRETDIESVCWRFALHLCLSLATGSWKREGTSSPQNTQQNMEAVANTFLLIQFLHLPLPIF